MIIKKCSVVDCENEHHAKTFCKKHYRQYYRYGHPKIRTERDKNEIIIKNGFAEIVLYDKNSNITSVAIIDVEDVEKIKKYKWYLTKQGYVKSNRIHLHRFIFGNIDVGFTIDHIDRNKLNNKKNNLRLADVSLQNKNRKTPVDVENRKRKVIINNIRYDSLVDANKHTKIPIETIRGWLNGAKPTKEKYKNIIVKEGV
jgi:hypothetical protein